MVMRKKDTKKFNVLKMALLAMITTALVLTGCGSSTPLVESGIESTSGASVDVGADVSSNTDASEKVSENLSSDEGATISTLEAGIESSTSEVQEATTDKTSEYGIEIDEEVDETLINYFEEPVTMYSQRALNVRTGPSTKFDILGYLEYNTEVKVLGQYGDDGWYLLEFFDGEGFASNRYLAKTEVDLSAQRAQEEAAALAAIEAETAEKQTATNQNADQTNANSQVEAPAPVVAPAGIVFIGDSRCVQMQAAVGGGGCFWVCENAKGYVWLNETAIGQANNIVGKGTKVVICLGVNDTQNIDKYAELVNAYAALWAQRGAKTYFCSVNPVWENPYRTEEQVIAFNNAMPGKLVGITWLDTHSWMETNGYRLVDGLHYDANTYINLFNYIIGSI